MRCVNYKFPDGDLASRHLAITQRHKIEDFFDEGIIIHLDLRGVISLSESYADEIFGVLVVKHGQLKVLSRLKFENASPSILKSIATAIQRRTNEVRKKTAIDTTERSITLAYTHP